MPTPSTPHTHSLLSSSWSAAPSSSPSASNSVAVAVLVSLTVVGGCWLLLDGWAVVKGLFCTGCHYIQQRLHFCLICPSTHDTCDWMWAFYITHHPLILLLLAPHPLSLTDEYKGPFDVQSIAEDNRSPVRLSIRLFHLQHMHFLQQHEGLYFSAITNHSRIVLRTINGGRGGKLSLSSLANNLIKNIKFPRGDRRWGTGGVLHSFMITVSFGWFVGVGIFYPTDVGPVIYDESQSLVLRPFHYSLRNQLLPKATYSGGSCGGVLSSVMEGGRQRGGWWQTGSNVVALASLRQRRLWYSCEVKSSKLTNRFSWMAVKGLKFVHILRWCTGQERKWKWMGMGRTGYFCYKHAP